MMSHIVSVLSLLVDSKNLPQAKSSDLKSILNIVLAVMGALAFLMLIIAGLRYTLSEGNPTSVADSKRMIIYTLVGLVIIALAATIVNFVVSRA
jgi:TRAP-type C4-dicarboxylate transport system permease small subunit